MLGVSDTEIEFFKSDVTNYYDIEVKIKDIKKQIEPLQTELKRLNKLKTEKQGDVISFMEKNDLDVCNTENACYEVKTTKSSKAISKADIFDKLTEFFNNTTEKCYDSNFSSLTSEEKARKIHNFIYIEGREINSKTVLKSKI